MFLFEQCAKSVWFVLVAVALCHSEVMAGELVYTPTNPTFGGNPNNASGLMSAASAQNTYKAPSVTKTPTSALDRFTANLESAVLNRLTVTAVNGLFDADGKILANRTITAGNYTISITEEGGNLVLTTSDSSNPGSSTKIVVGNVQSAELAGTTP
jgi:curli production assembly/transport component CsgF